MDSRPLLHSRLSSFTSYFLSQCRTALLEVGLRARIMEDTGGERIVVLPRLEVVTVLKSDIETNSRIVVSRHGTHTHTRLKLLSSGNQCTPLDPLVVATNIIIE